MATHEDCTRRRRSPTTGPRGGGASRRSTGSSPTRCAARGDALAVVDPANREALLGSPPRRLTWRELDDEVDGPRRPPPVARPGPRRRARRAAAPTRSSSSRSTSPRGGSGSSSRRCPCSCASARWRPCAREPTRRHTSAVPGSGTQPRRRGRHGARRRGLGAGRHRVRPGGGDASTCRSACGSGRRDRPPTRTARRSRRTSRATATRPTTP